MSTAMYAAKAARISNGLLPAAAHAISVIMVPEPVMIASRRTELLTKFSHQTEPNVIESPTVKEMRAANPSMPESLVYTVAPWSTRSSRFPSLHRRRIALNRCNMATSGYFGFESMVI